jgi:exonuclease III
MVNNRPSVVKTIDCQPFFQEESCHFKVIYQNCQSARNKAEVLSDLIQESNADIAFLTETWFQPEGDEAVQQQVPPPGFTLHSMPRLTGRGGGIAVVYRDSIKHLVKPSCERFHFKSFELCLTHVHFGTHSVTFACVYRPPPSRKNKLSTPLFVSEFAELVVDLTCRHRNLVILGDINEQYTNSRDPNVKLLKSTLDCHHLSQVVDKATHRHGHIIDWVIASDTADLSNVGVVDKLISDHYTITFNLNIQKPSGRAKRTVISRNI